MRREASRVSFLMCPFCVRRRRLARQQPPGPARAHACPTSCTRLLPPPGGEHTIERLLSVDQTCRLQRRSLYSYLADALTAKARGDPLPSL